MVPFTTGPSPAAQSASVAASRYPTSRFTAWNGHPIDHTRWRALSDASAEPFFHGLEPVEAVVFRHRQTGQDVLLVHGHQGDLPNDQAWRFSRFMMRAFWRYAHAFGIHSPTSPVANSEKRHKVERNYVKWIRQNRVALICGHTHRERFPRAKEMPYFNSGSCDYPSHITALEITKGEIALVRWRVDANEDAVLQVTRRVMAGPEPLATFDLRRTT